MVVSARGRAIPADRSSAGRAHPTEQAPRGLDDAPDRDPTTGPSRPDDTTLERRLATAWISYYPQVVRHASHLLAGDLQSAEDVAQETAIRLWQHPEVLDDGRPLTGWLRTVVRNLVVDAARRRGSRPTEVTLAPGFDRAGTNDLDLVDGWSWTETMLARLSPRLRAAVYEVYVRDRAVADVALELGIPVGTVKSRCHAALRQLRSSLLQDASSDAPGDRRTTRRDGAAPRV